MSINYSIAHPDRVNVRDASIYINSRKPFNAGNLTGNFATVGNISQLGRLPNVERVRLANDWKKTSRSLFVVWSYGTPIAWHDGQKWTRPNVRYSVTTSKHQGKCPVSE